MSTDEKDNNSTISRSRLKALPAKPGVYLMRAEDGELLYVGKAKDLRARVRSYFNGSDGRSTIPFLLEQLVSIETLVTEDERQALVLESDLIRKHRPKYNIRLKDDKAHLIVRIDESSQWPRIELVRKTTDDGARYLGPYTFSYEIRTLIDSLQRVIPLRTCSDRVLHNRVRPCLEHQIKRCCAPCCLPIDPLQYREMVSQAIAVLEGEVQPVVKELEQQRDVASQELRFEDASEYHNRVQLLKRMQEQRSEQVYGKESVDVFALYREGLNAELCVLLLRDGRLYESKTFGFENVQMDDHEVLSAALSQFYEGPQPVPLSILVPFELEDGVVRESLLEERQKKKVKILVPQRGVKRRLLELAKVNAKENFEARFSEIDKRERVLEALSEELALSGAPRIVECMDVSHFQGGQTVGAVVCFQDLQPQRARYRAMHLSQEQPDDFASMRELVSRHLSRGAEEASLCDLLIIDGGRQQLAQAIAARDELGLNQPQLIALAKKRLGRAHYRAKDTAFRKPERVFVEGRDTAIVLEPRSEVLQFLERIRDETHRVAIQFHRKTRKKRTIRSVLDDIPGIGPKRRKVLLAAFGSVSAIKSSSVEEIACRAKLPKPLAERVFLALHSTES